MRSITKHMGDSGKRAFSLREITREYGLSLNLIRKEIESRRLPVRRVGTRILVLARDLAEWLEQAKC